jgi:hypothetical protein
VDVVTSPSAWRDLGSFLAIGAAAVALTAWQAQADRSLFEPYLGALPPVGVMTGAVVGAVATVRC